MKKWLLWFCLLITTISTACAENDRWLALPQLKSTTPSHWTEIFDAKKRTIHIDTPVIIPDGETFPIIMVVPDWWTITSTDSHIEVDTGRVMRDARVNQFTIQKGEMAAIKERQVQFKHTNFFAPYVSADEVIPGVLTIQDVMDMVGNVLSSTNVSNVFDFENPKRIHGQFIIQKDGSIDLNSCSVSIQEIPLLLHSLPVLHHVGIAAGENLKDSEFYVHTDCGCTIQPATKAVQISGRMYSEDKLLAEDVPLCSFDRVRENIVHEIEDGHLRKIFSVELGYALYNEPGSKRMAQGGASFLEGAAFYAVPTWFVQCLYEENVKKDLPAYDGEDDIGGRNSTKMTWLAFNAQTGEMLSREKSTVRTADYAGFITWEEVR